MRSGAFDRFGVSFLLKDSSAIVSTIATTLDMTVVAKNIVIAFFRFFATYLSLEKAVP